MAQVLPIQKKCGQYTTKEINNVDGELAVRIPSLHPRPKADDSISHSYSNKPMTTRGKASPDLFLKNPLLLWIVLPLRTIPWYPSTRPDPDFSPRPVLDLNPVLLLWVSQSLPTRYPYEGREVTRRPRVRSLTIQNLDGSRRRKSVVPEGHTSPDEDGESRKRVGYTSPRSVSVTSSLDVRDFTRFKTAVERAP